MAKLQSRASPAHNINLNRISKPPLRSGFEKGEAKRVRGYETDI